MKRHGFVYRPTLRDRLGARWTRFLLRLGPAIAGAAVALGEIPAWGQQAPGTMPGPGYGYGHMWGGGWGWHSGMVFGPILMLLSLIGIVALIVWLVRMFSHGGWHGRGCPHGGWGHRSSALDILEERFAKGEIDKDEFEEKRKLLGR
jgi:putative membrane protein